MPAAPFTVNPEADVVRAGLLQKMREDTGLPTLGSAISRVVNLAASDDEGMHDLAYAVLSDVALTQKILRLSNIVYYRTASGKPVTTVTKAIFVLGFDTVKTSALAMLLAEGMAARQTPSVRSELGYALTASVVGRALARQSHYKDAEEAAVAALFKNVGRLLVAAYDPVTYDKIAKLTESGRLSPAHASMQLLGSSFDMLGDAVLADWQIPDTTINALSPLPTGALKAPRSKPEWMQLVAAFSAAAATLIPRMTDPGDDVASHALLTRFGVALNLDQEKLARLFATVARESRALTDNATMKPFNVAGMVSSDVESRDAAAAAHLPRELLLAASDEVEEPQAGGCHPSGKPLNARDLLMAGVQDVTDMMATGRAKANDLIMLALETLHSSMGFRFATVCLKDVKSNQFRARVALGEDSAALQAGFQFSATSSRDLFHLALENDADLMIADATDGKIRDLIPAWHRALLPDACSFIVLPLVVHQRAVGLFYADRIHPAPEGVPPDETALIKMLKGQVLAALGRP